MRRLDRLHSVGTLSASMAHEVKNAFVAVKTFVDLLLEQNRQADLADVVRLEMGRIDSILGQMRKFSGPSRPHFAEVHLHPILDRSLLLVQHLLQERKIKVTRSLAAENDLVKGDADQLEQAFINLLFNALDAMKSGGRLSVTTESIAAGKEGSEKSRSAMRIEIKDDGDGIAPANMSRLFEPFFTTKPDGTGLGLPITHRIVTEHHGTIAVKSHPGKGTAFTLVFSTVSPRE
jgi:signal transduction histidine kinase